MAYLDTQQGHQIYYRLTGPQSSATPVLFLHGGPGAASQPEDEKLFQECQRQVVWMDQRGCGKSRCEQPLENNTTYHLPHGFYLAGCNGVTGCQAICFSCGRP